MNYLVGILLNYMTEEEAFWSLRQLMENSPYLMSKWFNQDLTMVHTSHYQVLLDSPSHPQMQKLLEKYLPAIGSYLQEVNITPAMYTTEVDPPPLSDA